MVFVILIKIEKYIFIFALFKNDENKNWLKGYKI